MNREIKFRGIREEYNPAWHQSIFRFGNLLNNNSIGEVGYDLSHYEYAKVKPETIGQFTGLLDKEGNEIYEGDLLELANGEIISVSFKSGKFLGIRKNGTTSLTSFYWIYAKIVGNIYETVSTYGCR